MILLLDIGNTHTHLGLTAGRTVTRPRNLETASWFNSSVVAELQRYLGRVRLTGAVLCSVVPRATPRVQQWLHRQHRLEALELSPQTLRGIGIDYPRPRSIGPDRLANALAAFHHYGAPSLVVDFGTAVTFDVINRQGQYAGGIIAPGLAAMTEYLHEKTALLPAIRLRETSLVIGKSTRQAMLIGAVHGYRGLIHELVRRLKRELRAPRLPVIATGGCAELMASKLGDITAVEPLLTLEGLRIAWNSSRALRVRSKINASARTLVFAQVLSGARSPNYSLFSLAGLWHLFAA